MKLAIGTAQWGMNYGINNSTGITSNGDINKICSLSKKEKIYMIDTASGYGNCEKRIGKFLTEDFKVVSKFGNIDKNGSIGYQLEKSLLNLRLNRIYGYLFHDIKDLTNNLNYWDELKLLKESGKISKIGYSIYEVEELEFLIENKCIPDIVQLPFNILDRKFLNYFKMLKKMKVEIHIRSIFLQGLIFKELINLKGSLKVLKKPLKILENIAKQNMIKIHDMALHYPFSIEEIDYIVIGLDNFTQFKKILKKLNITINKDIFKSIKEINLNDKEKIFLNPSNW